MNIAKMMKEAQRMQERMAEAQNELAARTIEATAGGGKIKVTATGVQPISYQWRKAGTPIAGATSAQLTLTNVVSADAVEA